MFDPCRTAALTLLLAIGIAPAGAATITVTSAADSVAVDGNCTLREAILAANADTPQDACAGGTGADRIVFGLATPATIVLASPLPTLTATARIQGPGWHAVTLSGAGAHQVLDLSSPGKDQWFGLDGVTVTQGYVPAVGSDDGAGVRVGPGETARIEAVRFLANVSELGGGGLFVDGDSNAVAAAEVLASSFEGNLANGPRGGGGIRVADGASLRLVASTLTANRADATGGLGGGLFAQRGHVTVERSTFSANSAKSSGGAIAIQAVGATASLDLRDSTLVDNSADSDANASGEGGGLWFSDAPGFAVTIAIRNSVIASNHDSIGNFRPDVSATSAAVPPLAASGWNLIGSNAGAETAFPAGLPNASGDFVGSAATPLDPLLEPLADNGGTTLTHRPTFDAGPPVAASPVIDAGYCPWADADQRGRGKVADATRAYDHPDVPDDPASDGCDIGAVERGAVAGSSPLVFADGFEVGHTLVWSAEVP